MCKQGTLFLENTAELDRKEGFMKRWHVVMFLACLICGGGGVVCMAFLPVGCSAVPAHTAPPSGLFTSQAVPQVGLVSVLKARSADGSCAFLVSQGPFSTKQPPAV